jgi:D-alanyl-lipoteichoic acid acyltransferase DltB (MBOAT superfamily)
MEFILHFIYVVAIKDTRAWQGASPMELSMIGFWNLTIVWLKVFVPLLSVHPKISDALVVAVGVEVLPFMGSS